MFLLQVFPGQEGRRDPRETGEALERPGREDQWEIQGRWESQAPRDREAHPAQPDSRALAASQVQLHKPCKGKRVLDNLNDI